MESRSTYVNTFSIADAWTALLRNRFLILGILFIFLSGGFWIGYTLPTLYRAQALIHIGQINGAGVLENARTLAARLMSEHGDSGAANRPHLISVDLIPPEPPGGITDTIKLVSVASTPVAAREFVEQVYKEIAARHGQIYEYRTSTILDVLSTIDRDRESLLNTIRETENLLQRHRQTASPEAILLTLKIAELRNSLAQLNRERPNIIAQIQPPLTRPTTLLGPVVVSSEPTTPKRPIIVGLSATVGLLFSIIIVIFRESLRAVPRAQLNRGV